MGKGGIPDRWLPYSPMGSVVPGTCFIACKVPLKDELLRKLPEKQRFGPRELMKTFPKLGLLIDLTNTTRYYMKEDFMTKGIQYKKIFCPGQVIPPNSIVKEFNVAVDHFLDKFKESDMVIAVHCTHGVNRTGYFICRYMIEKMNIPPEEAVKRFQQARGHNIERKPYVDDLKNGCKGGSESNVPLKILPYHLEIKEKKYRPKRQSHNRNFNMKEKRFRNNDMTYNCSKLNGELRRTHIEDTADLCSDDRNNEPTHFKNKDSLRRGHSEKDKQQRQNSQLDYQRPHVYDRPLFDGRFNYDSPTSLYSQTGNPCYSQPNSSYLGSRNRQPGRFKSEQMDYCDNSKPQADINSSIPLSSCEELKKLNSSDFCWWREDSNRPGHNTYPVSQFHPQRPPQNSSSSIRPSNSQARFQRPPPCSNRPPFPQNPYQTQNRSWIRPSQPNRKPIPRHNTLSTPSTTNLNYEHSKFSLPCERNIQAQSPFQTCRTQTNINQKVQIDVKSDSRVS